MYNLVRSVICLFTLCFIACANTAVLPKDKEYKLKYCYSTCVGHRGTRDAATFGKTVFCHCYDGKKMFLYRPYMHKKIFSGVEPSP